MRLHTYVDETQAKLAAAYNELQSKTIRSEPGEHRVTMEALREAMRAIRVLHQRVKRLESVDEAKAS
jgi:hypothetical protein